jgi:hypothetical protein
MSYGSRQEKEVVIKNSKGEDSKFVMVQYDAMKGLTYQRKLLRILGPSFIAFQQSTQETFLINVVEKFLENLDQVEPAFLKELVIQGAFKEGRVTINFDNDFAGEYMVLYTLIQELVMFNFKDVFQALGLNQ